MKVYIAGAISCCPNYKEKFAEYERAEIGRGNIVLNPAALPEGMSSGDYMRICFAMIDCADIVKFLPDFIYSDGAMLEHQYCLYTSKPFASYPSPKGKGDLF